jgi:DNA (cytosine-5)-methyltransferase 1
MAGFEHVALVEIEQEAQRTLQLNRPHWNTLENGDVREFSGKPLKGIVFLPVGYRVRHFRWLGNSLGKVMIGICSLKPLGSSMKSGRAP